jgi:soluble lytic murein transglycosylase-like protein/GNAT superfamily N-acetyltransferase
MGLDSLYQDDINTTLDDRQQRPVAAPRQESGISVWNTIKAPFKGGAAGVVEVGGFGADTLGAFGDVAGGYLSQTDPGNLLSPEEMDKRRREGDEARQRVATGEAFSTDIGTGLRATARSMMPDPNTSNAVENVLFGAGRGLTKAIGYAATATPLVGATLFGADEALTESDRLKAEGVDITTRTKVGAVTGVFSGVGVALPVAGRTIAQTAALVVAGGPASYIAQQAASREILRSQDYTQIGDQYNPFDPVGLAVSTLLPAGFAAVAGRGIRAQQPIAAQRSLLDMAGNERKALRYDAPQLDDYAVQAATRAGVPPEVMLAVKNAGERSGNSNVVSSAGAKGIMQFVKGTWDQYGKGRDIRDPVASIDAAADFLADLGRQYGGDWRAAIAHYNGGGKAGEAVRAGRAAPSDETVKYLQRTDAYIATKSGEAVGKAAMGDPEAVPAARAQLVRDTVESWNLKEPTDIEGSQQHLEAIVRASDQLGSGSRVEVGDVIQFNEAESARLIDNVSTRAVRSILSDTEFVGGNEISRALGSDERQNFVKTVMDEDTPVGRIHGEETPTAVIINDAEISKNSQGKGLGKAAYDEIAQYAAARGKTLQSDSSVTESASGVYKALEREGYTVKQNPAAVSANGRIKTPDNSPVFEVSGQKRTEPASGAKESSPALDNAGTEPIGAEPKAPSAEVAQAVQAINDQAAQIAKANPDMLVQLDGMDQPMRLADVLEAIKKEADAEKADAPLIDVAARCFLSGA